jgi:hypothetical protein
MDLAFSHTVGFVKEGNDVGSIIHSLLALFDTLRFLTTYPGLQKFINHEWVSPILSSKPTDDSGPGLVRGVSFESIDMPSPPIYTIL